MRIVYFDVPGGNFGDDLNLLVWPQLLPDAFTGTTRIPMYEPTEEPEIGEEQFVGIGTLLTPRLPKKGRCVVVGSGAGYDRLPSNRDEWEICCVRGPLTAQVMGLDPSAAITDPAILVRLLPRLAQKKKHRISFMPHWQMAESGVWQQICHALEINIIDPRWSPKRVIGSIEETETLITQALHGAIIADALRVPWMPVSAKTAVLEFKWNDFCQTIGVAYEPAQLPTIWKPKRGMRNRLVTAAKKIAGELALSRLVERPRPILSQDGVQERLTDRLVGVLHALSSARGLKLNLHPKYFDELGSDALLNPNANEAVANGAPDGGRDAERPTMPSSLSTDANVCAQNPVP